MARRYPSLSMDEIERLFIVDVAAGQVFWRNVAKEHARLNGREAGCKRYSGKPYWVVKVNKRAYRRAQIILAASTGRWPADCVDHINGNSLDDRACNLRHATAQQNAMNHKKRAKAEATPMGVRATASGKFDARISFQKVPRHLGVFPTVEQAHAAYIAARKEYFGEFA